MNKIEELNNLFIEWKSEQSKERYNSPTIPVQRIDKNSFCYDGFVFDSKADTVLYILAESNLQDDNKSNDFFWLKGTYKLENNHNKIPKAIEEIQKYICNKISGINLQDISYMNINKRGGFAECDENTLYNYYFYNDKDNNYIYRNFILDEIKIIAPKIIVFAVGDTENKKKIKAIYDDLKSNVECKYLLNTKCHLSSSKFSIDEFKKIIDTEIK